MRNNLWDNEQEFYNEDVKLIAGIDEVGRGSWAGPLVVGIVIFPKNYINNEINDSKKITPKKREELYEVIIKNCIYHNSIFIFPEQIDKENNIKQTTKSAMIELIKLSNNKAGLYLIDAEQINIDNYLIKSFIKGDSKYQCIAAASIVAKVEHDRYMQELAKKWPVYGFDRHVGYGTKFHNIMLEKYGVIDKIHRKSYKPIKKLIER